MIDAHERQPAGHQIRFPLPVDDKCGSCVAAHRREPRNQLQYCATPAGAKLSGRGRGDRHDRPHRPARQRRRLVCSRIVVPQAPAQASNKPIKTTGRHKTDGSGGGPGAPANFGGTWDTLTSAGGHFELVLQRNGESVTGTFSDLNGNPRVATAP